jgi:hypothetical protein
VGDGVRAAACRRFRRRGEIGLKSFALATLVWIFAAGFVWSQAPRPSQQTPSQQVAPQPETPPPAAKPAAPENPGLFNEMGKALEKSLSILPTLKSPGETLEDLNAKAKEAGENLSRLANPSSVVTGHMLCPMAANGASECKAAADRLCQAKGFKEGKSLSMDSVEACSPKVLIPGRARKPDDCRTDNFVIRALCQ